MTPEQEHDNKQAVITAVFVVLALFAIFCALTSTVGADDSAYLRARAAIAINASLTKTGGTDAAPSLCETTGQSIPKSISGSSKPKATPKPEIWTFYAPFQCAPCEAQKADLKAWKDSPFAFRNGDVNNAPVKIESYPTTCWKVEGKWWSYSGWHGVKHLESEWQRAASKATGLATASASPGGAATRQFPPRQSSGTGHWTYPGNIRQHLQQSHGITAAEAAMLTREQLESLHDALHEGRGVQQIRSWAKARGLSK